MRYDETRDLELGPRAAAEEWAETIIEISALLNERVIGAHFFVR